MEPPSAAMIWDVLAQAMSDPMMEQPHRPTQVQVRPDPIWDELRPHLDEIGIECALADELDVIDSFIDHLSSHLTKGEPPGLLAMPGMTPEQVGRFYRAAADFYRRAPWKSLGYDETIRIECDRYRERAVVRRGDGAVGHDAGHGVVRRPRRAAANAGRGGIGRGERPPDRGLDGDVRPGDEGPDGRPAGGTRARLGGRRPRGASRGVQEGDGPEHGPPLAWELELLEGSSARSPTLSPSTNPATPRRIE